MRLTSPDILYIYLLSGLGVYHTSLDHHLLSGYFQVTDRDYKVIGIIINM